MGETSNGYYSDSYRTERYDKYQSQLPNSNITNIKHNVGSSENRRVDHDRPPFSRLFVVCSKQHSASDLRKTFEECGTVEDVWIVRNKQTKENRGIAYIKFSKMSEACLAVENLNDVKLNEEDEYPLKVLIAQPKSSRSNEDYSDETELTRLFVVIPKGTEEDEIRETFEGFGEVDYIQIVKDRKSGEKKGFGYIKYVRAYDAAKAVEASFKTFKVVMAEPRSAKIKRDSLGSTGGSGSGLGSRQPSIGSMDSHGAAKQSYQGFLDTAGILRSSTIGNRLHVQCVKHISADQLCSLFALIPGMELCDLKRNFSTGESRGEAVVVYNSVGSAIYAKEKLNGFEYPPGYKITVRYAPEDDIGGYSSEVAGPPTVGAGGASYCSVHLPPVKPKADPSSECVERLFVVCHPIPPPPNVLVDVFSRFGDLIDVFMLKNKNFGYAKYASADAAKEAIKVLHDAEVFGKKLKVLTAEPPKTAETARKRPRT